MVMGSTGALTIPASAATPVYGEDFSDELGTFTASGTVSTGTYGVRLSGSLLSDPSITSAAINLAGYSDVRVSYTRAASGLDLGESFSVASRTRSGTTPCACGSRWMPAASWRR